MSSIRKLLRSSSNFMVNHVIHVDGSVPCKYNGVQYAVQIANATIRLQAPPGSPEIIPEIEFPLGHVFSAKIVAKPESRGLLPRLDSFTSGFHAPDITSVQLRIAQNISLQKWRIRAVVLQFDSARLAEKLCADITAAIAGFSQRPKRLMFLVNPVSGGGNAVKIMKKKISPLLTACDCQFDHMVTTHAGHARDWIAQEVGLSVNYDGLIAVGGDGIFNEVLEGVVSRSQDEKITSETDLDSPMLRVGIIPAGSTDSIGCCIGLGDPVTALIHILLGDQMMLDVGGVFHAKDGNFLKFFCAFLGYGFFSDTLRNSEKQWLRRYLGRTRYMLAGAKTFFLNRAYPGYVSYRPGTGDPAGYPDEGDPCAKGCPICSKVAVDKSSSSVLSLSGKGTSDDWKTLDGRFTNVIAVSLSCRSEKSPKGLSPASHCGDGCLDLLLVKSLGRFRLLNYLVSISRGVGPKRVLGESLHACRAYELIFRSSKSALDAASSGDALSPPDPSASTVWNCDGEIILQPDIHVKVYCQLITMFGSGLETA